MGVVGIGIIYFLSYYIIPASPIRGSLILCVISLIDIVGLRRFRSAKKAQTITGQRVNLDL